MGRPAKSVSVSDGKIGKEKIEQRKAVEGKLQLKKKPKAPDYVNKEIKKIFNMIVKWLVEVDIASETDVFVIENLAVCVYHLREINMMMQEDRDIYFDGSIMSARSKFAAEMQRGCQELCLSPQARAKIGSLAVANKEETDPLMEILAGVQDE